MENKEKILNLYEAFIDEVYEMTKEEKKAAKIMSKIENRLWKTFNKEQKRLFDKWLDYESDRSNEVNKQTFIYAFSLATELFTESLIKDNKTKMSNN